jgi:septum formation protein
MPRIILASTSPRRTQIFSLLGLPFEAVPHHYEEDNDLPLKPEELVKHIAYEKARSLVHAYSDALIISSDTLVELQGKVFPKPKNREVALDMLMSFSGATHRILTGYTLINTASSKSFSDVQITNVTFKSITRAFAEAYVNREDALEFAGAYDHEHLGAILIDRLDGDFYGSIGLPLSAIANALKKEFEIDVLSLKSA